MAGEAPGQQVLSLPEEEEEEEEALALCQKPPLCPSERGKHRPYLHSPCSLAPHGTSEATSTSEGSDKPPAASGRRVFGIIYLNTYIYAFTNFHSSVCSFFFFFFL